VPKSRILRLAAAAIGLLVVVGAVMAAGAAGLAWTNTEGFCIGCHEMRDNVYAEYKGTIHDTNRSGVRAICSDCHVPRDWHHKVVRKVRATNEVLHKLLGTIETREKFEARRIELARSEWQRMKDTDSRECRNCHSYEGMNAEIQDPSAKTKHIQASKPGSGKTCIDCHKGITHELPAGAEEFME